MKETPQTFHELRLMIAEAKKLCVQVWISDGDRTDYVSFPVTKTYAYSLYKDSSGTYQPYGNGAYYDRDNKILYLN